MCRQALFQELSKVVAENISIIGIVVDAGMGTGSESSQLIVKVMDGDGRIGLYLAAEDAGKAIGGLSSDTGN